MFGGARATCDTRDPKRRETGSMDEKRKLYVGMDVHKDTVMVAVLPEGAPEPTVVKRLPNEASRLRRWLARVSRGGRDPGLLRGERGGLRAGAGDAELGAPVRDRGAVADSPAPGGSPQARPEGRDGAGAAVPGGGVGGGAGSDGTRGAGAGPGALPGGVSAGDPEVASLHPEVPGAAGPGCTARGRTGRAST